SGPSDAGASSVRSSVRSCAVLVTGLGTDFISLRAASARTSAPRAAKTSKGMPVSCGKGVLEVMTADRERPIARIRAGRGAYLGRAGSAAQDGRPPGERAGRGGPDGMRRAV